MRIPPESSLTPGERPSGQSARERWVTGLAAAAAASLLTLGIAGCGSGSTADAGQGAAASSPTSTSAAPPGANTAELHVVEIAVKNGKVDPAPGRIPIKEGEKVRLIVHSDVADEVHLHGYDIETEVGPGKDAVIDFTADQTGLFEVETHQTELLLTQLLVQ